MFYSLRRRRSTLVLVGTSISLCFECSPFVRAQDRCGVLIYATGSCTERNLFARETVLLCCFFVVKRQSKKRRQKNCRELFVKLYPVFFSVPCNRQFPSCLSSLFQREAQCKVFDMKTCFIHRKIFWSFTYKEN